MCKTPKFAPGGCFYETISKLEFEPSEMVIPASQIKSFLNTEKGKTMTNFEKIQAMSVEEMAKVLDALAEDDSCLLPSNCCNECPFESFCETVPRNGDSKQWLEQEARQ